MNIYELIEILIQEISITQVFLIGLLIFIIGFRIWGIYERKKGWIKFKDRLSHQNPELYKWVMTKEAKSK